MDVWDHFNKNSLENLKCLVNKLNYITFYSFTETVYVLINGNLSVKLYYLHE